MLFFCVHQSNNALTHAERNDLISQVYISNISITSSILVTSFGRTILAYNVSSICGMDSPYLSDGAASPLPINPSCSKYINTLS